MKQLWSDLVVQRNRCAYPAQNFELYHMGMVSGILVLMGFAKVGFFMIFWTVFFGPLRNKNWETLENQWKSETKTMENQWKTKEKRGGAPGGPMGPHPPLFSFVIQWFSIVFVSLFHWFSNVFQFVFEVAQKKRSKKSWKTQLWRTPLQQGPLKPCPCDRARNSVQDRLNESSVRRNPTIVFVLSFDHNHDFG